MGLLDRIQKLRGKKATSPEEGHKLLQASQNSVHEVNAERRQALLSHRMAAQTDAAVMDTVRGAAEIANLEGAELGAETQQLLAKYGGRGRGQVRQGNTIINNNTTVVGGRGGEGVTAKFKGWVTETFARQNDMARRRDRDYERKERSLSRAANKMIEKVGEVSQGVVEKMDPRRYSATVGNHLKALFMLFGFHLFAENFGKILRGVDKGAEFVQKIAGFFGVGPDKEDMAKTRVEFKEGIVKLFGGKEGETIGQALGSLFKEGVDYLMLKMESLWEDRAAALKKVEAPDISGWEAISSPGKAVAKLGSYLGEVLGAVVGGRKGQIKASVARDITEGAESSLTSNHIDRKSGPLAAANARNNWSIGPVHSTSTALGDASIFTDDSASSYRTKLYKPKTSGRNTHREVTESGNLTNDTTATIVQGANVLENLTRTNGVPDVAALTVGINNLVNRSKRSTTGGILLPKELVEAYGKGLGELGTYSFKEEYYHKKEKNNLDDHYTERQEVDYGGNMIPTGKMVVDSNSRKANDLKKRYWKMIKVEDDAKDNDYGTGVPVKKFYKLTPDEMATLAENIYKTIGSEVKGGIVDISDMNKIFEIDENLRGHMTNLIAQKKNIKPSEVVLHNKSFRERNQEGLEEIEAIDLYNKSREDAWKANNTRWTDSGKAIKETVTKAGEKVKEFAGDIKDFANSKFRTSPSESSKETLLVNNQKAKGIIDGFRRGSSPKEYFGNVGIGERIAGGIVKGSDVHNRANKIMDVLVKGLGFTEEQAAGFLGNLLQENSTLDPSVVNKSSGAAGIAQWLGSRAKRFNEKIGKPISAASLEDQLEYLAYELTDTEYKPAHAYVKGSKSAEEAAKASHDYYEFMGPDLSAKAMGKEIYNLSVSKKVKYASEVWKALRGNQQNTMASTATSSQEVGDPTDPDAGIDGEGTGTENYSYQSYSTINESPYHSSSSSNPAYRSSYGIQPLITVPSYSPSSSPAINSMAAATSPEEIYQALPETIVEELTLLKDVKTELSLLNFNFQTLAKTNVGLAQVAATKGNQVTVNHTNPVAPSATPLPGNDSKNYS